ncbi:hypothetical protein, partial [Cronobacter sakazakii]|uniref:hypothetical protein n=1 Tax=Cronobacter sakazakii TaxID=28141 RepID=UPI0021166FB5
VAPAFPVSREGLARDSGLQTTFRIRYEDIEMVPLYVCPLRAGTRLSRSNYGPAPEALLHPRFQRASRRLPPASVSRRITETKGGTRDGD